MVCGRDSRRPLHHTINTKIMECRCMSECLNDPMRGGQSSVANLKLAAMGLVALALGGCASASSSMFVNPAKYSLYNCQQLGAARIAVNARVLELERLMAKAETGAAGSLVSGLAYQTDYVSARAERDQLDEKLAQDNCPAPAPTAATAATPAETPHAGKRKRQ
jgi:hypothetical protein